MNRSDTNLKASRHSTFWVLAPAALAALGVLGCAKQQAAPQPRPAIPVVVGTVRQKAMPVQVIAVGHVEAFSTVSIEAQVPSQLLSVHFREGDFVRKGQLLLTLAPRPYELLLPRPRAPPPAIKQLLRITAFRRSGTPSFSPKESCHPHR